MGYRSEVAAAFYISKVKHFPVLKLWLDENFPIEIFKEQIRWFDRGMIFHEENIKWYPDYDEVKAFDAAVRKFSDLMEEDTNDVVFSYEFVRIGESYDDIETDYQGDECECFLGTDRRISFEV